MTTSQPQYSYPAVAAVSGWLADTDGENRDETVAGTERDTDGEPVGRADADEDIRRAGGDPDKV